MLNTAIWNVRGLNKRDHQLAVRDIVTEFRLQFLGLLETRVCINNASQIQSVLLPNWKWFVDYGSASNHVWITWDDNFVDVNVVECGTKYIHCHVNIRALHESIAVTVIYGANEIANRRELWGAVENIALQCADIPRLVGEDFNAVRDLSEVCGTSGDIRIAMNEFNTCIQNTGLLLLPMQGECSRHHSTLASPHVLQITHRWCYTKIVNNNMERRNKGDLTHNVQLAKGFLEMAQLLIMLQQRAKLQWMKGGDQCSRVFFQPEAVVNEFVTYYENLLCGERRRAVIDLRFLRPWARYLLMDVKHAVFDIPEDKAPGPDGYSSGFFKAAWPVVGQEVSSAVLDFFNTGRLLKQINTTLLALIPKVQSPTTVGDFRPISCCNTLYKIIAKLIVQWLSVILDKLISPCQAAFVPGRSIGDNIMLAQELFIGYNQTRLPPWCALKVDTRKAYDTVEWDFMIAVMELFGFPSNFMKWIETCITTPSFSVGLNGKPHGFFRGARGLCQGDPLSLYLFVLVMEVLHLGFLQLINHDELFSFHWKSDTARVFQLGFADDLLLFCRTDMDSIGVFKTGLDRFAEWSGLRQNVQKSHLIISRSAQGLRKEMLIALGFQEGVIPMRYLGLPLLSSRLTIANCRPLLLKIDKRIAGWEGMALSYAGAIGPRFGSNGYTRVGYKTHLFGRFRSMGVHGVGGKSSVYGFSSDLWCNNIRSKTGGDSTHGRTRGIILALLVTHFHGDRVS
ncbi:UNVERIFIED_CONTAM: hypothetical protein Sindi_2481300 [Sesamum indicum]